MDYIGVILLAMLVFESLASFHNDVPELSQQEAGKRRKANMGRIIGGEIVDDIKQYGFMASIQSTRLNNHKEESIFCAGFILAIDTIGTAAHCVYLVEPDDMDIRVGSTRISDGTRVDADLVVISPKYHPGQPEKGGNLAVVFTDDMPFGPLVYAINFSMNNYKLPEEGSIITVLGWGQTEPGDESSTSDQLKVVDLPKVSPDQCAVSYFFSVAENEFCAGTLLGGRGTCEGDMGGPALYDNTLVGVVAGGRGCGAPVSPTIFTDITHRDSKRFINDYVNLDD